MIEKTAAPKRTRTPAPKRIAAFKAGVGAEAQAAAHLVADGFEILAQRYRTACGEIDLIARRAELITFVEVKARGRLDDAAYAVTRRQQSRIIAAAQLWLAAHPDHASRDLRFDAILIAPGTSPLHLIAAFDASP
jgi:putative endonuclease